jgi:hypothetical protein
LLLSKNIDELKAEVIKQRWWLSCMFNNSHQ